ncbi:cytochrome c oxidase subunit CcoM [Pseudomonas aeruginosa]|nr:cytochrome c oxidase subunit CcoM [Pseudomonas aeruginosa]
MNDDDKVIDLSAERDKRIHDVHEKRLQEVRKAFEQVLPLASRGRSRKASRRSAEACRRVRRRRIPAGNVRRSGRFFPVICGVRPHSPPAKLDLGQCHAPGRKKPVRAIDPGQYCAAALANLSPSSNTQPATGGHQHVHRRSGSRRDSTVGLMVAFFGGVGYFIWKDSHSRKG